MAFVQNYNGTVGSVYNVEGNLNFGVDSGVADFAKRLAVLHKQIEADPEIEPVLKQAVSSEVSAAHAEIGSEKPDGSVIRTHLDKAAAAVESTSALAVKVSGLAKTLFSLGAWAVGKLS